MKKLLIILLFLAGTSFLHAQWVVQPYDTAGNQGYWLWEHFTNGTTSYTDISNNTSDFVQGTGSVQFDYRVEAGDVWGGYNVRVHRTDSLYGYNVYYDLSAGTDLSLDYKVVTPAVLSQAGAVSVEWKLVELNEAGERDLWFHVTKIDLEDATGSWINTTMPLEQNDDNSLGWALQEGGGDGTLQLDHVVGFEVAFVYITAGGTQPFPSAEGTILLDNMQLIGNRYPTLITFDNSAATWGIDDTPWLNPPGGVTLTDEGTDVAEGTGSLKFDYTLSAPEVWGGFIAIDTAITVDTTILERTALTLYIKNLVPAVADSGRAFIRVFIFENSDGVNTEEWITDIGIDLSEPFDWTRCLLPLVAKPMGVNDRFPPKDGFALKNGAGDGFFNPDFMTRIRIEPFGRGTEDGFTGPLLTDGSFLLDVMQQSGFQFSDNTGPVAVTGIGIVAGTYQNLVTWNDVPGEEDEKYNVYASMDPITDVTATGVDLVRGNLPGGTQVATHVLRAPVDDEEVTFYYTVVATDFAANEGDLAASVNQTNMAQGVTVIHPSAPPSFAADGDLSEWSGIPEFRMFPSDGSGTIVTNTSIDDDNDLSVKAWVAMDDQYLYVAFDVTDDIVNTDTTLATYLRDAPDMHLGLYDWRTGIHTTYKRGSEPDYQFRFNSNQALIASAGDFLMLRPTDENYYWDVKFPNGYIVECKLALADIAAVAEPDDDIFIPELGKRIRIDFGINDADSGEREGILTYSPINQDASWNNPSLWTYTWIGDQWAVVVGVDDEIGLDFEYSLSQNYPNPFNPTTTIEYSIAAPGMVSLKIYDILGSEIAVLINQEQNPGKYNVRFNTNGLSSGVYFYRIESNTFVQTQKMIFLK